MEKIESKFERTITETTVTFKAIDGTVFDTEEECKKYEATVEAVLLERLNDCVVHCCCGDSLFESNCDGEYKAVVPKTQKDIDTLNQLHKLYGGKNETSLIFTEEDINTLIFMGYRFYNSSMEWVWFYKAADIIKACTNGKWTVTPLDK